MRLAKPEKPTLIMWTVALILIIIFPFLIYSDWVEYNEDLPEIMANCWVSDPAELNGYFGGIVIVHALITVFPAIVLFICGFALYYKENKKPKTPPRDLLEKMPVSGQQLIHLSRLSKTYPSKEGKNKPVLNGLNLDIGCGEWITICGPGSSGKTTLANIICALDPDYKGDYLLNRQNMAFLSKEERLMLQRDHIAMISRDSGLEPRMNAAQNIGISSVRQKEAVNSRKVDEILASLEMEDIKDAMPSELSELQRLLTVLGQALYNGSKVIIADDPAGNLDPQSRDLFVHLLSKVKKPDTTVIMLSREPAATVCGQQIVYLQEGKIREAS